MYDERLYQVDFRASKIFRFGQRALQANVDLYNAVNASSILAITTTYGSIWLRPTAILQGRLLKFGGADGLLATLTSDRAGRTRRFTSTRDYEGHEP